MKNRILFVIFTVIAGNVMSQISINTPLFTYTQDFNTLIMADSFSGLPLGWHYHETGSNRDSMYAIGTGSSNAGNTYSFGASGSNERAMGGLRSVNLVPIIGAKFTNNTGLVIPSVTITYTGEQWRIGTTSREDRLDFQYSLDADSLLNGTWIDVNTLTFIAPTTVGPAGALNGNLPENRYTLTETINNLNIQPGAMFWIRWLDFDASGADDGIGIDDFIISNTPLPVVFKSFNAKAVNKTSQIHFATASERNNAFFAIERSENGSVFTEIGKIESKGAGLIPTEYLYTDADPSAGTNYYRIRQVDWDDNFTYSEIRSVRFDPFEKLEVYPTISNGQLHINTDFDSYDFIIQDTGGKEIFRSENVSGFHNLNLEQLTSGTYFLKIVYANESKIIRIFKI